MAKDTPYWRLDADIYAQARALGGEIGCPVIMPDRCKASAVNRTVPNLNSIQGSFEKGGIVDAAIGLCATRIEKKNGQMRYFVFINRHGPEYGYFSGKVCPEKALMTIDNKLEFTEDDDEDEDDDDNRSFSNLRNKKSKKGPKYRAKSANNKGSSTLYDESME